MEQQQTDLLSRLTLAEEVARSGGAMALNYSLLLVFEKRFQKTVSWAKSMVFSQEAPPTPGWLILLMAPARF